MDTSNAIQGYQDDPTKKGVLSSNAAISQWSAGGGV